MSRDAYPSEQADRFLVRMPPGLRERIAKAAKFNGRSMNSEIVSVLEKHYPDEFSINELIEIATNVLERSLERDWKPHTKNLTYFLRELRDRIEEETSSGGS